MSSPIVIHVLRPYANEEEYLAHERTTIDTRTMLLIDQPPLPTDTPIVFDIQLQNGQKVIRAEAKVVGHVAANGDNPSGLRVRFKRFGAATKAFIDRAAAPVETRPSAHHNDRPASVRPPPSLVPSLVADEGAYSTNQVSAPFARGPAQPESSGIHRRPVLPVAAPINREELLARLRTRAHTSPPFSYSKPREQAS